MIACRHRKCLQTYQNGSTFYFKVYSQYNASQCYLLNLNRSTSISYVLCIKPIYPMMYVTYLSKLIGHLYAISCIYSYYDDDIRSGRQRQRGRRHQRQGRRGRAWAIGGHQGSRGSPQGEAPQNGSGTWEHETGYPRQGKYTINNITLLYFITSKESFRRS